MTQHQRLLADPKFIAEAKTATTESLRTKYAPDASYSTVYRSQAAAKKVMTTQVSSSIVTAVTPPATGSTYVFLSDAHCPFQDDSAVEAALRVIDRVNPDGIYLLGDMIDFYALSRFSRDPVRVTHLQEEIDSLHTLLGQIRGAAPSAQMFYLEGNHETRLSKFLHSHPEMSSLEVLEPSHLFGLDMFDITWVPASQTVVLGDHIITHGDVVRKGSGSSARGQIDKYLKSGISGHTHRAGHVFRTAFNQTLEWLEIGHLGTNNPDYLIGPADWQHACAVGRLVDGKLLTKLEIIRDGQTVDL